MTVVFGGIVGKMLKIQGFSKMKFILSTKYAT